MLFDQMLKTNRVLLNTKYHNIGTCLASLVLAFFVLFASLTLADELPDIGDPFLNDLSLKEEEVIGQSIMNRLKSSDLYVTDPEITGYIQDLGYTLVSHSDDPTRNFTFFVLKDPSINAFALPGAFVGVHTGLIVEAGSESMLASVLGHEIAHVTQRHIARIIAAQKNAQVGSLAALAVALLASRSNGDVTQAAVMTSAALPIQNQLNFTRAHEREADRLGINVVYESGFDVHQMSGFFKLLQRQARLYETGVPDYLRTHPITSERIGDVESRVEKLPLVTPKDDLSFQLIRSKVSLMQSGSSELVPFFRQRYASTNPRDRVIGAYGLVLDALQGQAMSNEQLSESRQLILSALSIEPGHPMLLSLQAELESRYGDKTLAEQLYKEALDRYPARKSLLLGYAEFLLSQRQFIRLEQIMSESVVYSDDARFYEYRARAYEGMNRRMAMHKDRAEALVGKGRITAAINELTMAQQASDGDFYLRAAVTTRLKELVKLRADMSD